MFGEGGYGKRNGVWKRGRKARKITCTVLSVEHRYIPSGMNGVRRAAQLFFAVSTSSFPFPHSSLSLLSGVAMRSRRISASRLTCAAPTRGAECPHLRVPPFSAFLSPYISLLLLHCFPTTPFSLPSLTHPCLPALYVCVSHSLVGTSVANHPSRFVHHITIIKHTCTVPPHPLLALSFFRPRACVRVRLFFFIRLPLLRLH